MSDHPLLRGVDAITIPVPDLDQGLRFYRDRLGHALLWRHDAIGQAALRMPDSDTEMVLTTALDYAPNWLVTSVPAALRSVVAAGGRVLLDATPIPVGTVGVVEDPFGNALTVVDVSAGRYATDDAGDVTGVDPPAQSE